MPSKTLGVIAVLGLTLGTTACGYSCTDLCAEVAECPRNDTKPEDCAPECEIIERRNDDMGCDDEFDELLSCAGEAKDICDGDPCDSEAEKWDNCVAKFCEDHEDADDC